MVRVFVDTNVLVRYVIEDDEVKYPQVKKFFERVGEGKMVLYLSSVVLMEMGFVLKSVYGKPVDLINVVIRKLRKVRGCVIVEKTNLDVALAYLERYRVKFSDCLIASSVPKGVKVFSYDRDFQRMKLDLINPETI